MGYRPTAVALIATLASIGCSSSGGLTGGSTSPQGITPRARAALGRAGTGHPVSNYISHVVVIIQENRSFENFFAGFPGANAPTFGCAAPSPTPSPMDGKPLTPSTQLIRRNSGSGCPPNDTTVPLHSITFDPTRDLRHDWKSSMVDWNNGNMDGFEKFAPDSAAYAYVEQSQLKPYWTMAQQYVLADAMFPTEFGGSFTGHLMAVAGNDNIKTSPSRAIVDFPTVSWGCDSPPGTITSYVNSNRVVHGGKGPFPCFTQFNSIAQDLDAGGVSWKYYVATLLDAGLWSPFETLSYVRKGPDWKNNIVVPQTKILTDPGSGNLASVSFVTPSKPDSDHPGDHSDLGPSWVASVVNAIGQSNYWNSTAIIVIWDDWGGWYDNAPPPQLDYRGLGIRVPCLIISPYARETSSSHPGYVSHTQYEFGSILRFIEEVNGLPYIGPQSAGYTDSRANTLDDSFDFTQAPRPFVPITSKYPRQHFLHEPPSSEPVDTQ